MLSIMSFTTTLTNKEFTIFDEQIISKFHSLIKESFIKREFEIDENHSFKTYDEIPVKINISISKCRKIIEKLVVQE